MAQWSERSPFTSEVPGSSMLLESSAPLMRKELLNTLSKVVGFLPALLFLPTKKLIGWVGKNIDGVVKSQLV